MKSFDTQQTRSFGMRSSLGTGLIIGVLSVGGACGTDPGGSTTASASSSSGGGGEGGTGLTGNGGAGGVVNSGGSGGAGGGTGGGGAGGGGSGGGGIREPQGNSLFLEVYDNVTKAPVADSWVGVGNDYRKTDAYGQILFENLPTGRTVARILAQGYMQSTVVADLVDGSHAGRMAYLLPLGDSIALDADAGGMVDKGNVRVTIPAGALLNETGQPVTGMVEAHIVPIDPSTEDISAMPGPLVGQPADAPPTPLLSIFMADISFTQGDQLLQLKPGTEAELEFVIPDVEVEGVRYGETIPAWWYDTYGGYWIEDGQGYVVDSALQPGKLAWKANVRHFTQWNADAPWTSYERNCFYVTVRNQFGTVIPNNAVQSNGIDYWNNSIYNAMTSPTGGPACVETLVRKYTTDTVFSRANIYSLSGGSPVEVTAILPPSTCPNGNCRTVDLTITTLCNPGATQSCDTVPPIPPCTAGVKTCNAQGTAFSACQGAVAPQPTENCLNSIDDNCNGTVNDGCVVCATAGETRACYSGPPNTAGVGICRAGTQACNNTRTDWGPCMGEVLPRPAGEDCTTAVDDDCDGNALEFPCVCVPLMDSPCYTGVPTNTQGVGACRPGSWTCLASGQGTGPCNGQITPLAETCGAADTIDQSCDGTVNEGCAPFGELYGDINNQAATTVSTNRTSGEMFVGGWFQGQTTFGMTPLSAGSTTFSDAFLVKFNPTGNTVVWAKKYGDSAPPLDDQIIKDSVIDANGDIYITGTFGRSIVLASSLTTTAEEDGFVAKISAAGNPIWSIKVGAATAASRVTPFSIALGGDGNLVIAGSFTGSFPGCGGTCSGTDDIFVQKIGNINTVMPTVSWTTLMSGVGSVQEARGVAADAQGNVFVTGNTSGPFPLLNNCLPSVVNGGEDAFIAKLNAAGTCQWRSLLGNDAYNQRGTSIAAAADGSVWWVGSAAGATTFPGPCGNYLAGGLDTDVFYAHYGTNGNCLVGRRIVEPMGMNVARKNQDPHDIQIDAAGNFAITGEYSGTMQWAPAGTLSGSINNQGSSLDLFVARFLSDGQFRWVRSFGDTTVNQIGRAIAFDTSNFAVVAGEASGSITFPGYATRTSQGASDVLLMKLQP